MISLVAQDFCGFLKIASERIYLYLDDASTENS